MLLSSRSLSNYLCDEQGLAGAIIAIIITLNSIYLSLTFFQRDGAAAPPPM